MGTRHLIAVFHGGQYKIAQYGQWDGYPEGQGRQVLSFLRKLKETGRTPEFLRALGRCFFYTGEQLEDLNDKFREQMQAVWELQKKSFTPKVLAQISDLHRQEGSLTHLSRDVGAEILDIVLNRTDEKVGLSNSLSFAGDSLFCEWAYVIDFDEDRFEVYKGFNNHPTAVDSRFPSGASWLDRSEGYEPVRLVKWWPISALPAEEEFLSEFEEG